MKKLFLLGLPLLAILFYSCSKDDDGSGHNGNGDTPKYGKLVKEIEIVYAGNADNLTKLEYEYDDQQRVIKVSGHYGNYPYNRTYTYENKLIIETASYGDKFTDLDASTEIDSILLNDDGYAISNQQQSSALDENPFDEYEYTDGHLSGWIEYIHGTRDESKTFVWSDGNLTAESSHVDWGMGEDDLPLCSYTYGDVEDKTNLYLVDDNQCGQQFDIKMQGWSSKNFLIAQDENGSIITYSYTFDSDGYPTQIVETYGSTGSSSDTVTISYY